MISNKGWKSGCLVPGCVIFFAMILCRESIAVAANPAAAPVTAPAAVSDRSGSASNAGLLPLKAALFGAIRDGAGYAAHVLLDERGKSRCDYHMVQGKWHDYEPAWHTGQIIYALVECYRITGDDSYLLAARRAGDWWIGLQITDHPRLEGMVRAVHGDQIPHIVFATISDGSAGLFRLSEATGESKYADTAASAGQWMLEHMYVAEQRLFYDVVDPGTGEVLRENSPFWPGKEEQGLFDVARPNNEGSLYKDMYEHTGNPEYRKIFLGLCDGLLDYQDEHGLWMDFMPNDKASGYFHPRFNLWYAESLLEGWELTGDERYLNGAAATARFYAKYQQADGTFYYKNYVSGKINRKSICGSAVAFAGLIWLRLLEAGAGEEFRDNVEKSVQWLLTNRYPRDHADENLAGGFFETRVRFINDRVWIVNRDIATSFALRFLTRYLRWIEQQECD